MIIPDERLFVQKVRAIYRRQKHRAKKDLQTLTYTAEALLTKARAAVTCPYCACVLTTESLSFDHRKAVACGGLWTLENLTAVCAKCNTAKDVLHHDEMMELMATVLRFSPRSQHSVLTRLRRGPTYLERGKR